MLASEVTVEKSRIRTGTRNPVVRFLWFEFSDLNPEHWLDGKLQCSLGDKILQKVGEKERCGVDSWSRSTTLSLNFLNELFSCAGGDKQPWLVAEPYGSAEAQNGRHRTGSRVSNFLFSGKIRISFRIKKCKKQLKEINVQTTEHCGRSSIFWFFCLNIFMGFFYSWFFDAVFKFLTVYP